MGLRIKLLLKFAIVSAVIILGSISSAQETQETSELQNQALDVKALSEVNNFFVRNGRGPSPKIPEELALFRKLINTYELPGASEILNKKIRNYYDPRIKALEGANLYCEYIELTGRIPAFRASKTKEERRLFFRIKRLMDSTYFTEGLTEQGEEYFYSPNIYSTMAAEKYIRIFRETGRAPPRASFFMKSVKRYQEDDPIFKNYLSRDPGALSAYEASRKKTKASFEKRIDVKLAKDLNRYAISNSSLSPEWERPLYMHSSGKMFQILLSEKAVALVCNSRLQLQTSR